jgi:hypothetical protein
MARRLLKSTRMKKIMRNKLSLSSQTLRVLEGGALVAAAGGRAAAGSDNHCASEWIDICPATFTMLGCPPKPTVYC